MEELLPIYTKYTSIWRRLYASEFTLGTEIDRHFKLTEEFERHLTFKIINAILEEESKPSIRYSFGVFSKPSNHFINFVVNNFEKFSPEAQFYFLNRYKRRMQNLNAQMQNKILTSYKIKQLSDKRHGQIRKNQYNMIKSLKETIMKKNVGGIDKNLRIVAGSVLVATGFFTGNPWFFLGIVPLATGLIGFCPFYPILGINSCPLDKKE